MTYWFNLSRADREIKAAINKCDICNERLECADNIEDKIVMLEEINDSYLHEYDRHEPRLLFCRYCRRENMIPSWLDITWALLWKLPKLLQIWQFSNITESFELIAK